MTDRYTKAVLTVIAACLVWNIVSGSIRPATAQLPNHVIIDQVSQFAFQFGLTNPIPVHPE